jgi:hypothetical protein
VTRRVGLALNAASPTTQLSFADLQTFSRHIVPFSPTRVKESVLSGDFHKLHDGLNMAHLSASGWSAGSYLELISNLDARKWWAQCIGEHNAARSTEMLKVHSCSSVQSMDLNTHSAMRACDYLSVSRGEQVKSVSTIRAWSTRLEHGCIVDTLIFTPARTLTTTPLLRRHTS